MISMLSYIYLCQHCPLQLLMKQPWFRSATCASDNRGTRKDVIIHSFEMGGFSQAVHICRQSLARQRSCSGSKRGGAEESRPGGWAEIYRPSRHSRHSWRSEEGLAPRASLNALATLVACDRWFLCSCPWSKDKISAAGFFVMSWDRTTSRRRRKREIAQAFLAPGHIGSRRFSIISSCG